MPKNRSKAVPEGNSPVPHHDEFGSDQPTMADLHRLIIERFDRSDKQFNELTERLRATNQRLTGFEYKARQRRLATEGDVKTDKTTCKRTEGAAAADRAKHNGNSSSARRVDDGPTSLTSFGKIHR